MGPRGQVLYNRHCQKNTQQSTVISIKHSTLTQSLQSSTNILYPFLDYVLNHLCTFDSRSLTDWDATAHYIINATGCHMALSAQPSLTFDEEGNETENSHKACENWEDQNVKAFGNLMLWISLDIRKLIVQAQKKSTKDLFEWLKTQYSTTTISAAYTDVIAINKLFISGDCDPTPVIDKLHALFTCLKDNKLIYPELFWAVMLFSKLPAQMEEITRNYNHKTADATSLTFLAIRDDVIMSWQQRSSKKKKQNSKQREKTIKYTAKRQGLSLPLATIAARGWRFQHWQATW